MVLDKIKDMLEKQLGIDKSKITEDSDIIKDIGADSLDIVEFPSTAFPSASALPVPPRVRRSISAPRRSGRFTP